MLDCLYEDYPGVRAILGERRFMNLATAFLAQFPSASFTLRNLGSRLPAFIHDQPAYSAAARGAGGEMARFEWAQVVAFDGPALPILTQDDVLDSPPTRLRVALQPYITVIECAYPVDEFALALKKRDTALRGEASNAPVSMPGSRRPAARSRLPRPERIRVAVHRQENMLYFKRLEPEAFAILTALARGPHALRRVRGGIAPRRSGHRLGLPGPGMVSDMAIPWLVLPEIKTWPPLTSNRSSMPIL